MVSTGFLYDAISSEDMGVSIVRLDKSLPQRPFTSGKEILETHGNRVLYPHFFGVKYQPITFNIVVTCVDDDMDDAKMYQLGKWLFQDSYKPFISTDDPTKVFYCMAVNQADFYTNGFGKGYFEIQMRCRDGFGWTVPTIETFDLSDIVVPTTIEITNLGNILEFYEPELEFTLQSTNTALKLKNLTDSGREFEFTGLNQGETIYVNNRKRVIISDVSPALNRFDKFNRGWLRLKQGVNSIQVTGKCTIDFRIHFPIFN